MGRLSTALAVSAGALAAVYVAACILPNGPSDAGRVQFTLDFPVPYRVPLAGVVEPLITISADGQVLNNPSYRLETLDAGIVRVDSTERRLLGVVRGTAAVRVTFLGATGTPDNMVPVQVVVSRIAVGPPATSITRLGATTQLSATAYDAKNATVPNVPFTWSSADSQVATVTDAGLVRAVDEGTVAITAEADSVAGVSSVVVTQVASQVRLLPELDTLHTVGRSVQFLAIAFDDTGGVIRTARPRWSSSNASVARVDSAGVATATGGGTASIVARVGTAADTATLVVAQVARLLIVTPGLDTLTAIRDTGRVVAIASDSLGNPIPNPTLTWVTSDTTIATVDAAGLVTAAANGVVLVTAASAGHSAFATIVVRQAVAAAQLSTHSVALVGEGDTVRLSAVGLDKNGYPVTNGDGIFAWRRGSGCVASLNANEGVLSFGLSTLVTARGAGETSIIVTPSWPTGRPDTATVTVTGAPAGEPTIAYASVQGIEAFCAVGSARTVLIQFEHTGDYPDSLYVFWGPAWSPDGARLAFYGTSYSGSCGLYIARADGSEMQKLLDPHISDRCSRDGPAWSPDGTKLAFAYTDTIYVVNADGSNVRPLFSFSPGRPVGTPTWSPDGTQLAFGAVGLSDSSYIYVMNADGSGAHSLRNTATAGGGSPAWSPDGSQLAFVRLGDIWLINLDGSGATNLTQGNDGYVADGYVAPAWSPDGSRLVFQVWIDGYPQLFVINRDGTGLQQLDTGPVAYDPTWRRVAPPPGAQVLTGTRRGLER